MLNVCASVSVHCRKLLKFFLYSTIMSVMESVSSLNYKHGRHELQFPTYLRDHEHDRHELQFPVHTLWVSRLAP